MVLTKTTSPGVNRPWLQPQTVKIIAPAIIRFVTRAWPMLSHASETSLRTVARAKAAIAES